MKALDLLKEQYNILNNGIDGIWINPKKLDEAIKELEELQSRTCENCKYLDMDLICTNEDTPCCSEYSGRFDNFNCNKWELKK